MRHTGRQLAHRLHLPRLLKLVLELDLLGDVLGRHKQMRLPVQFDHFRRKQDVCHPAGFGAEPPRHIAHGKLSGVLRRQRGLALRAGPEFEMGWGTSDQFTRAIAGESQETLVGIDK